MAFWEWMAQWGPVITLILALSFIIVAAILVALYLKDSEKLFASLTYTAAVCVTLTIIFGCFFIGVYIIFAALAILMLRRKEKYIPWAVWGGALGTIGFSALILLLSGLYYMAMDILLIPSIIICTVLLIAVTIVRACLKKKLFTNNKESKITTEINEYVAYREGAKGYVIAGNIFAALSYVLCTVSIRTLIFPPYMEETVFFQFMLMMLVPISLSVTFGGLGWVLLKKAKEISYIEFTPLSKFLYIWSIVPAILMYIIGLIIFFIASRAPNADKKKIVKIKDPKNGETIELEYWGNINETCEDKYGRKWKTENGGKSFAQCGVGFITDELGRECKLSYDETVQNGTYTDNYGNRWETDDFGKNFHSAD